MGSINFFMVCDGSWGVGVWLSMWASKMLRILGCSRAMHVHVLGEHVHCSNHSGIMISWGWV